MGDDEPRPFPLHQHFSRTRLSEVGLSRHSEAAAIEAAAARELGDLDMVYGDEHGVSEDEMLEYLTAWVQRERAKAEDAKVRRQWPSVDRWE